MYFILHNFFFYAYIWNAHKRSMVFTDSCNNYVDDKRLFEDNEIWWKKKLFISFLMIKHYLGKLVLS